MPPANTAVALESHYATPQTIELILPTYSTAKLDLDQRLISDRVRNLIADKSTVRRFIEDIVDSAGRSVPGYDRHSLALMCTYGDPFELYSEVEKLPELSKLDALAGGGVDLLGDDSEVKHSLDKLRDQDGIISLVINPEYQHEGRYTLKYSGIDLPAGRWEDIRNHYGVDSDEGLLKVLSKEKIGTRTKAMLNFSIMHPKIGESGVWFLVVNSNDAIIQNGYKIDLKEVH